MVDLVGGAVLGVVFQRIYKAISDALKLANELSSSLKKLDQTLRSMEHRILKLRLPEVEMQRFTKILDDGETLIRRCSKVCRYNWCKKWWCAMKIKKFQTLVTEASETLTHMESSRSSSWGSYLCLGAAAVCFLGVLRS